MDPLRKSLQKLGSHPKPQTLTPNFQSLLLENDRHKETFGRVIDSLPLNSQINLLMTLAQGAQMVYLRAGDLVYEQGSQHDTGHQNRGIYYIARGAVTSVWVPGEIRKSRREREEEYFKELHRIRKEMLQTLISKKRLMRRKSRLLKAHRNEDADSSPSKEDEEDIFRTTSTEHTERKSGMSQMISVEMEKELRRAMNKILAQTTGSKNTLADTALEDLCAQIPGLTGLMSHFQQKRTEAEEDQESEADLLASAEEDYVNAMLAPTDSFMNEMINHGADIDGSGHISQQEVDIYRQVRSIVFLLLLCSCVLVLLYMCYGVTLYTHTKTYTNVAPHETFVTCVRVRIYIWYVHV